MELKNIHTRFRAYQLSTKGSSFSYWDANTDKFVLGEARLNDDNIPSIIHELKKCGKEKIDDLYISSWDKDHCSANELEMILKHLKPSSIYYPRYLPDPEKQNQVDSKRLIDNYDGNPKPYKYNASTGYPAEKWVYDQVYLKQEITCTANDNSLISLWRRGNFSVLSVGDLESVELSELIANDNIFNETDIYILSHHGSSKDFNSVELLKALKPKVCLALVDRENQYGHPDNTVYQRANEHSWYYSTKNGDVIIETNGAGNEKFTVYNYITGGENLESVREFDCKRFEERNKRVLNDLLK